MLKQSVKAIWLFSLLAMVLVMIPTAEVGAAAPTVNGLFYGDGDVNNYVLLGQNPGRGDLYYYVDGDILYMAVVVDPSVNDNVFAYKKSKLNEPGYPADNPYLTDAAWLSGPGHSFADLLGSDHVEINFQCGTSPTWNWLHGYLYDANGNIDPTEGDWLSGPGDTSTGGGSNIPPANVLLSTASSLMWNMNYAANNADGWDVTFGGTRSYDSWKSVDTPYDPTQAPALLGDNDLDSEEGWGWTANPPTGDGFNDAWHWEWAMVYEMSIDLGPSGANCSGPWMVDIVSAHNSPVKSGSVDVPIKVYDFGDAPDSFGTALANNGPRHEQVDGGLILGFVVDAEGDGQPNAFALGDDQSPSFGADDEDGVLGTDIILEPGQTYTLQVSGTVGSYLDAWIDFNADGDFDIDERITPAAGLLMTGGWQDLTFTVPASMPFTTTYGRFRVSSAGGLDPVGPAADGEVEDYAFQVHDFGDAPDSTNHDGVNMSYTGAPGDTSVANFPTVGDPALAGDPGMCHLLTSDGAFLGNGVSGEKDADMTPDADIPPNLDPQASSNDLDSDDGLTLPGYWYDGVTTAIQYKVTVPAGGVNRTRYVNLWFDWNRDGDWADAGVACRTSSASSDEHAVVNRAVDVSPGSSIDFTSDILPCNPNPLDDEDAIWVRITLSDEPVSATDGSGPGSCYAEGETEDWYFTPQSPTSVDLASFEALAENSTVLVTWETATELNILGFDLERAESPDGPWTRLNSNLIASAAPGSPVGSTYDFADATVDEGLTYYYRLASVGTSGASTYHGPVRVLVPTIGDPLPPPAPAGVYRVYLPFVGR